VVEEELEELVVQELVVVVKEVEVVVEVVAR
jgi:hypothetical protein